MQSSLNFSVKNISSRQFVYDLQGTFHSDFVRLLHTTEVLGEVEQNRRRAWGAPSRAKMAPMRIVVPRAPRTRPLRAAAEQSVPIPRGKHRCFGCVVAQVTVFSVDASRICQVSSFWLIRYPGDESDSGNAHIGGNQHEACWQLMHIGLLCDAGVLAG